MIGTLDIPTAFALSGTAGLGMSLGFLFVRWAANFIAGRIDHKEARVDAGMAGLLDGLKDQVAALSKDCRELRDRVSHTESELRECKRKHAESEAQVMQLRAMLQGYGDARQVATLKVAADRKTETGK